MSCGLIYYLTMLDVASRGELQNALDQDLLVDLQRWQFRSRVFFGRDLESFRRA